MCLMLYLGSDNECLTSAWDETNPQFFVSRNNIQYRIENQGFIAIEEVKSNFSKQFIYYVGSNEGCGCGFRQEGFHFQDDENEISKTKKDHKRLFEYVSDCLKKENTIELYACWAGNEKELFKSKRKISARKIADAEFFFNEDELIIVEK